MGDEIGGWAVVVVCWVAVAWAGGWMGVLHCAEEVHCPRGFLERRSVNEWEYGRGGEQLTFGATLRDAMITA